MAVKQWLQIKALIQKNIYMKMRKKSETIQEILLPIYFVALLIVLKLAAYKPITFEESGLQNISSVSSTEKYSILLSSKYYVAPDTPDTRRFMEEFIRENPFTALNYEMFADKDAMDKAYLAENTKSNNSIGIFFPSGTVNSYAIRYPYSWFGAIQQYAFDTNARNCRSPTSNCPPNVFLTTGYSTLQVVLDAVVSRLATNSTTSPSNADLDVTAQLLPLPAGSYNTDILPILTAFYLVWAFSPFLTFLLVNIVMEKEKKVKECMSMMGMSSLSYWLSWTSTYTVLIFVMTIIVTLMAKFGKLFENSNFFLLFVMFFLYGISIQMFAYMITPFFSRTRTAGGMGAFGTLIMSLLYLIVFLTSNLSEGVMWVISLLSPTAFCIAVGQAQQLENAGVGAQWYNMTTGPWPMYIPIVMLVVDCFLYFGLTFYLDQIVPGEYGNHKHPLFFLMPSYWSQEKRKNRRRERALSTRSNASTRGYDALAEIESANEDWEAAIRLKNVTKTFTKNVLLNETVKAVTAVKNFSLEIYKGQITALLGHNGAGKTTIFNILAGFVPITSGSATIYEYDVANGEDMDEIRQLTGVCPQSNDVLFDYLSVEEHLNLYAGLKGIDGAEREAQTNAVLGEIGLIDEKETFSRHLSGGQKRKLCVGLAILGDPKILILDEPTAGMDPYSRRNLWNLLTARKDNCVTLLTTHFMDEADILADRKAIISNGRLRCVGSSLFLKNKYGVGYHLGIVKDSDADVDGIKSFVGSHISGCELKRDIGQEMSFILPLTQISKFAAFFSEFESKQNELGVQSYGVSMTTLEEVFLKLGEESEHDEEEANGGKAHYKKNHENVTLLNVKGASNEANNINEENGEETGRPDHVHIDVVPVFDPSKSENSADIRSSAVWRVLLWRVYLLYVRSPGLLIFSTIIPAALTVASVYMMTISPPTTSDYADPNLINVLDESYLKTPYLYNQPDGSPYSSYISSQVTSQASNLSDAVLLDLIHQKNYTYIASDIAEYTDSKWKYKALYNSTASYSLPASINVFSNALIANLTQDASNNITTYLKKWPSFEPVKNFQGGQFGSVIMAGIGIVIAVCLQIVAPIKERELKITPQLRVSGVSFTNYWTSLLAGQYIIYLFPAVAYVIAIAAFNVKSMTSAGALVATIILLIGYGVTGLLYSYCCSFFFTKHETAVGVWPTAAQFLAIIPYVVVSILDMYAIGGSNSLGTAATVCNVIFLIFLPYYDIFSGLYYISKVWLDKYLQTFDSDVEIPAADYFNWSYPMVPLALLVTWLHIAILWCLLYVITIKKSGGSVSSIFKKNVGQSHAQLNEDGVEDFDEDVKEEREKASDWMEGRNHDDTKPVVVVQNMRKTFLKRKKKKLFQRTPPEETVKVAVRNLSMTVFPGEVVGLLGPNGAGKTTSLNVLTADIGATMGKVSVAGCDITSNVSDVYQVMGYCPQVNPLWDTLTLEEHLEIYAAIRGVKKKFIKETVDNFITGLAIEEHREKRAKTLSGGTMRKLCFAMSMLGNPQVVLMDEPSTGMDPKTKRFMWNTISRAFEGSSRGAILTTHYMEEADALCHRVGIMVRGQLKCIGTTQHLKDKYGTGYVLEMKLSSADEEMEMEFNRIHQFVTELFPSCGEPERFEQRIVYKINREDVTSLGKVFTKLELSKTEVGVEEYSFSQSTLEQVFLEFAKEQELRDEEERKEKLDKKKKK